MARPAELRIIDAELLAEVPVLMYHLRFSIDGFPQEGKPIAARLVARFQNGWVLFFLSEPPTVDHGSYLLAAEDGEAIPCPQALRGFTLKQKL